MILFPKSWKIFFKAILTSFLDVSSTKKNLKPSKRLLIVKVDGIGDYVLFRNCLKALSESDRFNQFDIDLITNSLNKDLTTQFDSKYLNNTFFVPREKIHLNQKVRNEYLNLLNDRDYDLVINWTFSRVVFDDLFIRSINAKNKISFEGDDNNQSKWMKSITNSFYCRLLPTDTLIKFEFERNWQMLEFIVEDKIGLKTFGFDNLPFKTTETNRAPYVVFAPGASSEDRVWSSSNYSKLADLILENNLCQNIIICGSKGDGNLAKAIINGAKNCKKIMDITGTLKLSKLPELFNKSVAVISSESGLTHIAAASRSFYYCISNGNHLGRFHPYPEELICLKGSYFYPPQIEKDIQFLNFKDVTKRHGRKSTFDTSEIPVEKVFQKLEKDQNRLD